MSDGPAEVAGRFLQAIVWGEHVAVWEMLSPAGREAVLAAGERRGLDPLQAQRLRLGTSPHVERDTFLTGLVRGLRVDFANVAIEETRPVDDGVPLDDGSVEVALECPASFGSGGWAAGTVVLSQHRGAWLVDRLAPVVSGGT